MSKKNFTIAQINQGIARLNKRIYELHELLEKEIPWNSQDAINVSRSIVRTIKEVFGRDSDEYKDNSYFTLRDSNIPPFNEEEQQKSYLKNICDADGLLKGLRKLLSEEMEFIEQDPTEKIRATFDALDFHPRIADACGDLFHDGHYRNAVQDAAIALVHMVQEKSHNNDLDGTKLMEKVFSKNSPILAFNKLEDQTDRDEQEGFMYLFKGATLGIRNPRSHALNQDGQQEALELIAFLSLLAKLVDKATLV